MKIQMSVYVAFDDFSLDQTLKYWFKSYFKI